MRFKSRSRATAVAALAATVSLAGLTTVAPAGAAPASTDRVSGDDRYGTAAEAATTAYTAAVDTVVITTGEKLPDALSANPIAGANDAPILLVQENAVPASTQAALQQLSPDNIIIVGGTAAVSAGVEAGLAAAGFNVTRESGADRFETSAEVALAVGTAPDVDFDAAGTASEPLATVALANGITGLADAVAAAPMLHQDEIPLLLTGPDTLNEDAAAAIQALNVEQVLILGGTMAISNTIEQQLEADGINAERLSGGDRFGTGVAIADFEVDALGFDPSTTFIASGFSLADALSGGPLASVNNSPILLVSETDVPVATQTWLEDNAADIDAITALGGTAVINESVLTEAAMAADEGDVSNETYDVTPDETAILPFGPTPTAGNTRTFSATVPAGTVVDIALFPTANVNMADDGTVTFDDTNSDNVADPGVPVATVTSVNGVPGATTDGITSGGTITFTVNSAASADVVPVVFGDSADDDDIDLVAPTPANNLPKAPTDPVGVGGRTVFVAAEAGIGSSTPTVTAADTTNDYFTSATATYNWDSNDIFQYQGVGVTQDQFESMISVGDVLTVSYNPDAAGTSTFNVTTDAAPTAPAAPTATVTNADGEATANDARVTYTPPATNASGATYTLQRGVAGPGVDSICGTGDDVAPTTWTNVAGTAETVNANGTRTIAADDQPNGCFAYRVVATNPVSGTSANSPGSNTVAVPAPADVTGPLTVDARMTTVSGLAGTFDTGDVFKVVFGETIAAPAAGDTIRATDGDGTIGDFVNGTNATFALNAASETVGGTAYPAGRVLTVTLTAAPTAVAPGTTAGLQVPATVTDQSGTTDTAGNPWTIAGGADNVIGNPDN